MKNIKVVAFDCDGVLFDTTKANMAYYNQILANFYKPEMTPDQFAFVHMHTVDESLAYLFSDQEELEKARDYRKLMSYTPFIAAMEIEPYLKVLLQNLRPKRKTAIATNRTDTINRVLKDFGLEADFDLVVSALDVNRPKPYPDPLIRIIEYFQIKPTQAIYIGDSILDELAAKAAGIPLAAYRNTSLSAEYHITSLKEIEAILNE